MTASGSIRPLPLWLFGLEAIPGFPVQLEDTVATLGRLLSRTDQTAQATLGLNQPVTLGGQTRPAYDFLFGEPHAEERRAALRSLLERLRVDAESIGRELLHEVTHPGDHALTPHTGLQALALEEPDQFSMMWTTFPDTWSTAQKRLPAFAACLTDPDAATRDFWPTLANSGLPYNLLILEKVTGDTASELRSLFADRWTGRLAEAAAAGRLYAVDLRIFERFEATTVRGLTRFTPAAVVLLAQDADTLDLAPVAIRISDSTGNARVYGRTGEGGDASGSAWIYACQAARTAITVYGIWLGHVYTWHLVPGALQMTLLNEVPETHPLRVFLDPTSKYLIGFDNVLLLLWPYIAPPTALADRSLYLKFSNRYAHGREYFDDDPPARLEKQGLAEADFSSEAPWDRYPIVGRQLELWDAARNWVETFVDTTYADDGAVASDAALRSWMKAAGHRTQGNLRGLPTMTDRQALADVLTSHAFRILVHGASRLVSAANPDLTFAANYPPCLQRSDLPAPDADLGTADLLGYLPKTGTLGLMVHFYFTFSFSHPYEPLIPVSGLETELSFPGGLDDPRNRALVELRRAVLGWMERHQPGPPQRFQWPRNVET